MRLVNCTLLTNGEQVKQGTPIDATIKDDSINPVLYRGEVVANGRLVFSIPDDTPPGGWGATIDVNLQNHTKWSGRTLFPLGQSTEGPLINLVPSAGSKLQVEGDHFLLHGAPWVWRGSTEFRLPERVKAGADIRPILRDRKAVGVTLVRMLSMKKNNTGYEFNPKDPQHRDAVRKTFDTIGNEGLYSEWVIFADTATMMPDPSEQQAYYNEMQDLMRQYPFLVGELVNEDKHPTQKINSQAFRRPEGILFSHGSGLSDVQPVQPLWDFATYHARRFPPPPNAKPFNNLNPYEFHPVWPHPVPYVCEEHVKPEDYGFNPRYAKQMGRAASLGPGATFHHNAWLEERLFNDGERACAEAFFKGLGD